MAIQTRTEPPPLDVEELRGVPEATRARYPESEGFVERDGQQLFYEVYGEGEETIFLLPTWSLVHSRHWKMQIAYFARHFRVLMMDGLGNGRSDRCRDPQRYGAAEFARDCLAVMDATGTERAVMASLSTRRPVPARAGAAGPRAGRRRRVHRPAVPLHPVTLVWLARIPSFWARLFRRPRSPRLFRWWGRINVVHWREDTRSSRSGSSRAASRSRTRPRRSRTAWVGRWRPTPRR